MPRRYKTYRPIWPRITVLIFVLLLLAGAASVFVIRSSYRENLKPVSALQKTQIFTIPKGAGTKEIAVLLKRADLIRSTWAFEWYVRLNRVGGAMQAGTYDLRQNQSVEEIVQILTQGDVATDLVTIVPGQRLDQVREALIQKYGFDPAQVDAALQPSGYADHPALVDLPAGATLEGYLYPESFQKSATTEPATIIRAALDEMHRQLTPDIRAGIVRQGLSVHDGVILASVVGREVSNPDDKRTVAQVFLRRLREGHRLQSDATASYGAILAGITPTRYYDSAYNTYTHDGLPPTPISNVNASSLAAVANPTPTDYLYFVSGDDGKTYFSHTLEQHQTYTRQHCTALCR